MFLGGFQQSSKCAFNRRIVELCVVYIRYLLSRFTISCMYLHDHDQSMIVFGELDV